MSTQVNHRTRPRWLPPAAVAAGAVVLIAAGVVLTRATGLAAGAPSVPTFEVRRGPLTISVIEAGTIKSQEQVVLKNELEGQTTLIYLMPEGTRVSAGELLAELDASRLHDDRVEQQIRVENAQAAFVTARENLAIVKSQAETDISKAELTLQFAREDVVKYFEGEYPQELRVAENKITIAREELARAREKRGWSERLYKEEYISNTERQADELAEKRAQLDYDLAVAAKELLERYTHKRQYAQLQSDVEQAAMALQRTRLKSNADVVQAEAQLKAKDAELAQQRAKLAKVEEQIRRTKLVAPRDGLVVYATSTRTGGGRGGMQQPLEEGQTVRERQELIYLPSTSAMMAELMIHESSLEKVQPGQPVSVAVDAMPGKTFTGVVKSIAPLPDAQSTWMNPDRKVYATRVNLDGDNPDLRTGMSCRAEILVEQLADATYVPVQAVVRIGGQPTVFAQGPDGFAARVVEPGLDNSSMVHIVSGLTAGEIVSLAPPLDAGTTRLAMATGDESRPAGPGAPQTNGLPAPSADPAAGPAAVPPAGSAGPPGPPTAAEGERAGRRERAANMTPEERAAEWRKRLESLPPEQREEALRRMRERQAGRGERGERGGGRGERGSNEGAGGGGEGERGGEGGTGGTAPAATGGAGEAGRRP